MGFFSDIGDFFGDVVDAVKGVFGISSKQQKKRAKMAPREQGQEVSHKAPNTSIPVQYGYGKLPGLRIYATALGAYVDNTTNDFLRNGITESFTGGANGVIITGAVFCHDRIDSFVNFDYDSVEIADDKWNGGLAVEHHKDGGSVNQLLMDNSAGEMDANAVFTNTAHAGFVRRYNATNPEVFGIAPVEAYVRGMRCYDVREAGQSETDQSTWTFSRNPIVCIHDYITGDYGGQVPYREADGFENFDTQNIIDTSNICDILVQNVSLKANKLLPASDSFPITTYSMDFTADRGGQIWNNIKNMQQAIKGGGTYWSGGQIKYYVPYLITDTDVDFTITDEDIIGNKFSRDMSSLTESTNHVEMNFDNIEKNFQEDAVYFPNKNSALYNTFLTEDHNLPLPESYTDRTSIDPYHAEDIAEFFCRIDRGHRVIGDVGIIGLTQKFLGIERGDAFRVTSNRHGVVEQIYIAENVVKDHKRLLVVVHYVKYEASFYEWTNKLQDDPLDTQYVNTIQPAENLAFAPGPATDNGNATGVLTWTAAPDERIREYKVFYKRESTSDYIFLETTTGMSVEFNSLVLSRVGALSRYDFRVISITAIGSDGASADLNGQEATSSLIVPAVQNIRIESTGTTSWLNKDLNITWDDPRITIVTIPGQGDVEQLDRSIGNYADTFRVDLYRGPDNTGATSRVINTMSTSYNYSFEDNLEDGNGVPASTLTINVTLLPKGG